METGFRPLDMNEMALLEKLLDHDFPGRDALRLQLSSVTGRQIDENGVKRPNRRVVLFW